MVALVSVETILILLLVVLVAGLLRSHAEILRRLGPEGDRQPDIALRPDVAPPPPRQRSPAQLNAITLAGSTPAGDAISLSFDEAGSMPTLLAFLSSGCTTCAGFWQTLGERRLPPTVQTVIVTKGPERERPARLRALTPNGVPVLMSSQAWQDYRVPGAPYFVLVDGAVRGEGVASTWPALASLVSDAIADRQQSDAGTQRARRVDSTLAAAGIDPEHPSLYPGGRR